MSRWLPLFSFLLLAALLGFGIVWHTRHDPREVRSPLINKPAPAFALPSLYHPQHYVHQTELLGRPYLLNIFASWCFSCAQEHPLWMAEGKTLGIDIIGYDYKDTPAHAKAWLAHYGNPYRMVIVDHSGAVAIDWGIYGVPESFLIDRHGIIRYKRVGPFTMQTMAQELKPAIAALARDPP